MKWNGYFKNVIFLYYKLNEINKNIYVSNLFYFPLISSKEIEEYNITENRIGNERVIVILNIKMQNLMLIMKLTKIY